jgi:AcrR family transcriptional regulator
MAGEVKSGGVTGSSRRSESALRTRRAIVDAARELFARDGYAATTIAVIAEEAGVAVQTVYAVFGNKPAVMAAVIDRSIAGDDAPVVVNARDWMRDVWEAPTGEDRLRAYAGAVRRIMEGAADVLVALDRAAAADPDLGDLAATTEGRRRTGATAVVDSVREVATLRPGLRRSDAVDVLWLLNSPMVFHHLTHGSGWSPSRYERWLAGALVRELLAPGG